MVAVGGQAVFSVVSNFLELVRFLPREKLQTIFDPFEWNRITINGRRLVRVKPTRGPPLPAPLDVTPRRDD